MGAENYSPVNTDWLPKIYHGPFLGADSAWTTETTVTEPPTKAQRRVERMRRYLSTRRDGAEGRAT